MFNEWAKIVQDLNTNRTDEIIEEAKRIRKKYITKGRILKIIGILSAITSISVFVTFSIIGKDGFIWVTILSSLLFPISIALIGFGATYSRIANQIDVILSQKPLMPNIEDMKCPNCGDFIKAGEVYCSNCGKKLEKTCPKCGHSNSLKSNYCEKCGEAIKYIK